MRVRDISLIYAYIFYTIGAFCVCLSARATVGPVTAGTPLWCVTKSIGITQQGIASVVDIIESQMQLLSTISCSSVSSIALNVTIENQLVTYTDLALQLSAIESAIGAQLTGCYPTAIKTAPTTISIAGIYCVSNQLNGSMLINASNVQLNLNGNLINGTITVASNVANVQISYGTVDGQGGAAGIVVSSGTKEILIESVLVRNAILGVNIQGSQGLTVDACTLQLNTTGLFAQNAAQVICTNVIAQSNTHAGFDLVSCSTNSLIGCEAINTGKNNSLVTNNTVIGFSALNGHGNVFERCIANSTQALSTTDSSSVVAGFALRGTEGCTKIINSESANAITSSSGVTIPYGILLQASVSSLSAVTGALTGADGIAVNWSLDGQYVAVGGTGMSGGFGTNNQFQIFQFNRVTGSLTAVAGSVTSGGVYSVNWSPDGQYVAIGGSSLSGNQFQIFQFNRTNNSLTLIAGALASAPLIYSVNWSYDAQYVVVCGAGLSNQVQIYQFNRVTNSLTLVAGLLTSGGVQSVNWSPDGQYVAVGGSGLSGNQFQILLFNRSNNNLASVGGALVSGNVQSVNWSPDGQYIAVGGSTLSGNQFQILEFNRTNNNVSSVSGALASGSIDSVNWSPDGQYIAVGGQTLTGGLADDLQIFKFDRGSASLTLLAGAYPQGSNGFVYALNWSPDGQYIGLAGSSLLNNGVNTLFQITAGLKFPSQNVISGNTVYCNGQSVSTTFTGAVGVGISGSSIGNMIIENTAYNNPPVSSNFFVGSNYYFVTNVFNPLFGQAPTELQNISLNGNTPIVTPLDINLLLNQLLNITGILEASSADFLTLSLPSCYSTSVSGGTTITQSGNYCVSQGFTGNIVINANNVNLDLNTYTIIGSITIGSAQSGVLIKNGLVNANGATNGIVANTGASNITLANVIVKNAILGVQLNSVAGANVQSCTLVSNTTGMQLQSSSQVYVSSTVASQNKNAGFDLLSSATNTFINCEAFATGQSNTTKINNFVAGFTSYNGYGNIFERCIANGTQALSTTDSSSLVAGFVLRGSEGCTKIINSESANAIASSSGVTIPYGILLQGTLDGLSGVTGALDPNYPSNNDFVTSVNWSPDGQYMAIGGELYSANNGAGYGFQIYSFNRSSNMLLPGPGALNPNSPNNDLVHSVNWSPDDQYVAVGGRLYSVNNGAGYGFQIYRFDRSSNMLLPGPGALNPNSPNNDLVQSVNWSPDGQYVAVGGLLYSANNGAGYSFQIYSFNRVTNTLIAGPGALSPSTFDLVQSVNWSPDGQYVAVGGELFSANNGAGYDFQIYRFDRSSNILLPGPGALNPNNDDAVQSVNWSPDGQYVAVGGQLYSANNGAGYGFQIYSFNRVTNTLIAGPGALNPNYPSNNDLVQSVNWISDGQYVAVGGLLYSANNGAGYGFQIYRFDRSSNMLLPGPGALNPNYSPNGDFVYSLNWSPDGQYVVVGGQLFSVNSPFGFGFEILTAFQFPSQNVISGNTVYCNGQSVSTTFTGAVGVGISGSSIGNMIIGNTAYDNPPVSSNFFVPSNYYFVTNVFNQLFGQAPTALQNISLNGNTPITTPLDINLAINQSLALAASANNVLAGAVPYVSSIATLVCGAPTLITATTTIASAGVYSLCSSSVPNITINASTVVLDLNGQVVTGGITVNAFDQILIRNGIVQGSGIQANSGATNVSVRQVRAQNATMGITYAGVVGGTLFDCQLYNNGTGVSLTNCAEITIDSCHADSNTTAGYSLVSSSTNLIINSKALNTGFNNATVTNSSRFGFVCQNGYGNIIDKCVANATQALSTTDYNSIVAGIALRGSETCSRVYASQAAYSTTSASGFTVPLGIWLEDTLSNFTTFTAYDIGATATANTISWSPDGRFLALGVTTAGLQPELQIFSFNRLLPLLQLVSTQTTGYTVDSIAWSPDNRFIALSNRATPQFVVYSFCDVSYALRQFVNIQGVSRAVAWASTGTYIATARGSATDNSDRVYFFDRVAFTATLLASSTPVTINSNSVSWHPSNQYVAVGRASGAARAQVEVLQFIYGSAVMNSIAAIADNIQCNSVAWSPDGNYLAAARSTGVVNVYQFTNQKSLNLYATITNSASANSVAWSQNGMYLAVGYTSGGSQGQIAFYSFVPTTLTTGSLNLVAIDSSTTLGVNGVAWTPDGTYLTSARNSSPTLSEVIIYNALTFPSKNMIINNTAYCNTGGVYGYGVGIQGSSVQNLMLQNKSYNNYLDYAFVPNVFNQLFLQGPTLLQNISLDTNKPINADDLLVRARRVEWLAYSLIEKLGLWH